MTTPVVLVHGTFGLNSKWWKPDSQFAEMLSEYGIPLLSNTEPFRWTGELAGIPSFLPSDPTDPLDNHRVPWAVEGRHLVHYCHSKSPNVPVSLIMHSHGGQVGALAIAYGELKVHHFITLSTPVRKDMEEMYRVARASITGKWIHVYGDWWRDIMQKLGQVFDGHIGWRQEMPDADVNLYVPGGHSTLVNEARLPNEILEVLKQ